jgi:hypothetical protein
MTFASAMKPFLDYLTALGREVSLGPLIAGIFFIYLTIQNDDDSRLFATYALTAVSFFLAAVLILMGVPQIDLRSSLALVGLQ